MKPPFKNKQKFDSVILAAGNSTRIGIPKLFLFFDERKTFIEKIVETFIDFGCKKVIVVINSNHEEILKERLSAVIDSISIVLNNNTEAGRFYSLKLGLKQTVSGACFMQNTDNPFTDVDILKRLCVNFYESEYVIPSYNGKGGHPILIGRKAIDDIINEKSHDYRINEYLKKYKQSKIQVDNSKVLVNIDDKTKYFEFFNNQIWEKSKKQFKN